MKNEIKQRVEIMDICKGVLIFLVCWIHIAYNLGAKIPMEYMFPCAMGIFFLLSGYFYKSGQTYKQNIKKKFFQLIVPAVIYTFISSFMYYITLVATGNNAQFFDVIKSVCEMFFDKFAFTPIVNNVADVQWANNIYQYYVVNCAVWFLFRLFFAYVIFYAVAEKALSSVKNYIIAIIGLLSMTCILELFIPFHLPFLFDNCFAIAAILLTGSFMNQKGLLHYIENKYKSLMYWVVFAVILAVYVALYGFDSYGRYLVAGIFGKYRGFSVYIWFVTTLANAYLFMVLGMALSKIKYLSNALKYIGARTLTILCMHHTFASCIALVFGFTTTMRAQEDIFRIERGITLFVSLFLCLALDYAIKKIKYNLHKRTSTNIQ